MTTMDMEYAIAATRKSRLPTVEDASDGAYELWQLTVAVYGQSPSWFVRTGWVLVNAKNSNWDMLEQSVAHNGEPLNALVSKDWFPTIVATGREFTE